MRGDGRFANRPYGGRDGDGSPHARGHGLRMGGVSPLVVLGERGRAVREPPLRWGWVPACARTREGELVLWGLAGVGREHTRGDHKGRPYRGWEGIGVRRRGVGMGLSVDVGLPAGVQVGGLDGAHNVVAEFFAGCAGVAAGDDELPLVLGANVQGLVEAV